MKRGDKGSPGPRIGVRPLVFAALVAALVFAHVSPAGATTTIGSTTYSSNTTWTSGGSPYVITGVVSVSSGATLTIQPGVIVKFGTGTTQLLVSGGKLNAAGTAGSPIVFTSLADDSVGGDDANSNQTSKTDPLSHTVSRAYDDLNRLISITDGRGKTTTYGYDAAGNRTSITDPLGNQATYSYDDAGRMIASVDARGTASGANPNDYKTTYGYDEAGNQTTRTDPLGHVTAFVYDHDGRLHSKTDPLSHSISYGYDAVGRLQSVTAPDSSTTTYGYDDVGNLTSRTDANLHTTAYGYDAAQRLTSITNPLGNVWTFAYDADDEPTSRVDAIANAASNPSLGTTTYAFDRAGRETGIDYSDSTPDVTYGYDNANRLTSMTDGAGSKSYAYDNANRLTSIGRGSASFTYSYDNANNLTQTTDPDSTVVSYGYDNAERLSSMTNGSNTTSYGYDEAGNLTSRTLPNAIVESRNYDHAGQLSEISAMSGSTAVTDFQVIRDAAGNPTQVSKLGGAVETYGYDNFGRLTSVCFQSSCPNSGDPKISWTYDSIGRRQTETRPSGTVTYAYNAGDQVTSTTDGSTTTNYTDDADGRETGKGSSSFAHDMAGDLASATIGSTTTTYSYDGDGNRLSASTASSTTSYLWDENTLAGLPQLARESDGSGNLIGRYLSDRDGASTLQTGSGSFYDLHDQAGGIAKLADGSANTEWSYAYEPFGATRTATKVDPSAPDDPVRFDGQYLDPSSGLYDLRARQYDAADGRFLSTDPLAPALTDPYVSAYVYANDQPTLLADPSGMSAGDWAGTIMWRATGEAFDGVMRIVHGAGHLMSIGIHICEMATPWGVLKHLCAPILVTVAFAALSPEFLFASESEGLLGGLFSREAYGESRGILDWTRGLVSRLWSEERGSLGGGLAAEDEYVNVANEARTTHILRGDETGGGHLWPGVPGKTPFPEDWSAARVMHEISDVATDPASTRVVQGGKTVVTGTRDGVEIRVIIDNKTGEIRTGYPTNLPRNP